MLIERGPANRGPRYLGAASDPMPKKVVTVRAFVTTALAQADSRRGGSICFMFLLTPGWSVASDYGGMAVRLRLCPASPLPSFSGSTS